MQLAQRRRWAQPIISCAGIGLMLFASTSNGDDVAGASARKAARPELKLPDVAYSYADPTLPSHVKARGAQQYDNTPSHNPVTDAGATLGRVLFYDTRLSANDSVACASCHVQQHAFADPRPVSVGFRGHATDRNAMTLVDLRYSKTGNFWDERAQTIEETVLIPLQSRIEMGQDLATLAATLSADERYAPLFRAAFDDEKVTSDRIARALAQFIRSIVAYESRYDEGMAEAKTIADDFDNFSTEENHGKRLFVKNCAICHVAGRGEQAAFFGPFRTLNNGIDRDASATDGGRADITLLMHEVGLFKPGTLRNVEHTAPYMHDGRFATLEEVIDYYSDDVEGHPNASPFVFRMHFSDRDKAAMVAFLKTLSDPQLLRDPKFSNPWVVPGVKPTPATAIAATVRRGNDAKRPTASKSDAAERSARIGKEGLARGETYLWLMDHDADRSGSLDRDELSELIAMIEKQGITSRLAAAAGKTWLSDLPSIRALDVDRNGQIEASEVTDVRRAEAALADLNSDQRIDAKELALFEQFDRWLRHTEHGRDVTRWDRFLKSFDCPTARLDQAKSDLLKTTDRLQAKMQESNKELIAHLQETLGEAKYEEFQTRMLDKEGGVADSLIQRYPTTDDVVAHLAALDRDHDGLWSQDEIRALAEALDESPGGFAKAPAENPKLAHFVDRMLAFDRNDDKAIDCDEMPDRLTTAFSRGDADADGRLTADELTAYVRSAAYEKRVEEGLYVGVGFANAFRDARKIVAKLDLSAAQARHVGKMLDRHDRGIDRRATKAVAQQYERLKTQRTAHVASSANK